MPFEWRGRTKSPATRTGRAPDLCLGALLKRLLCSMVMLVLVSPKKPPSLTLPVQAHVRSAGSATDPSCPTLPRHTTLAHSPPRPVNGVCRCCTFSTKTKHPVLTQLISNLQNPFSAPKFWSPACLAAGSAGPEDRQPHAGGQPCGALAARHDSDRRLHMARPPLTMALHWTVSWESIDPPLIVVRLPVRLPRIVVLFWLRCKILLGMSGTQRGRRGHTCDS